MEITGLNQNYNTRSVKSTRQASTPINEPRDIAFKANVALTDKFLGHVKSNSAKIKLN